jgi:hypothetical protein
MSLRHFLLLFIRTFLVPFFIPPDIIINIPSNACRFYVLHWTGEIIAHRRLPAEAALT